MNQYTIRYMTDTNGPVQTDSDSPWDFARNALDHRNKLFRDRSEIVRCWIEETRGGWTVDRYGAVLKRSAP